VTPHRAHYAVSRIARLRRHTTIQSYRGSATGTQYRKPVPADSLLDSHFLKAHQVAAILPRPRRYEPRCILTLPERASRGALPPRRQRDWHVPFRPFFAYTVSMFQRPTTQRAFVIRCKGCGENIPAPVETSPSSWIAAKCPLCGEHRRYLPNEIFQGRLSFKLTRKPVRSAGGR
jgi:hypothetical protein